MLNICICQLIKDEQRYIEEWIDYHLNLGISKFVLFEDYNSTSHSEVLSKYGNKVILYKLLDVLNDDEIKVIKDNTLDANRQHAVWQCFYRLHKNDFDCCFFIDPDEYIHCDYDIFHNELQCLYEDPTISIIRYKWKCVTANGNIKDPFPNQKYSIVNTYTQLLNNKNLEYDSNFKCVIFLRKIKSYNDFNHIPHGPWKGNNIAYSTIPIYHYLTKSWEEYVWRLLQKGEQQNKKYDRKLEMFFEINTDLLSYKDDLMKEYQNVKYKYNDYT